MAEEKNGARLRYEGLKPLYALRRLGVVAPRASGIVNRTLVDAAASRSMGGRRPSQYLETWRNKLGQSVGDAILASHAVDPRLLEADDWAGSVRDRGEKLRRLTARACAGAD